MSIMPQNAALALQKLNNSSKKQIFVSKKLMKLAPIQNHHQKKPKYKVSICDSNLLIPEMLKDMNNNRSPQSINELLTPDKKNHLFSNKNIKFDYKNSSRISMKSKDLKQIEQESFYTKKGFQKIQNSQNNGLNSSSSSNSISTSSKIIKSKSNMDQDGLNIEKLLLQSGAKIQTQKFQNEQKIDLNSENNKKSMTFSDCRQFTRTKIKHILESIHFQIFITILTICSLFMEDFRTIFIDEDQDTIIDYVNMVFLSSFFLEILMSLTVQNYAFSFFFYLDIISTVSICMDITLFTQLIYNSGGNSQQLNLLITQSKASRAAARAVRIMKIFRLARVVKLYKSAVKTKQLNQLKQKEELKKRLKARQKFQSKQSGFMNQNFQGETSEYKLSFNHSLSIREKQVGLSDKSINDGTSRVKKHQRTDHKILKRQNVQIIDRIHEQPQDEQATQNRLQRQVNGQKQLSNQIQQNVQALKQINPLQLSKQQSNISKILSDSTIKKIIIVILIIMFSITALDINNYYPDNTSWDFLTQYVAKLLMQKHIPIQQINKMIEKKIAYFQTLGINSDIVAFQTPFNQLYSLKTVDYNLLRMTEIGIAQADISVPLIIKLRPELTVDEEYIQSKNSTSEYDSITVVISYKSFNSIDSWFSIGKIIFICLTIIYLLQSFNTNISDLIVTPIQKMLQIIINPDKKLQQDQQKNEDFKQARYETLIVQKAIIKIRGLMSTIFGKIGMDLIYNQLFKSDNIATNNYLSVKKKNFCIYGICKINNFVEISETLQNDTFTFVNQIAHIVHSAVYRYGGYGVKNLSDGFLVVFKLPQGRQKQIVEQAMKSKVSKQKQNTYLNILSDYSIFSFIKMIVRLHKEPKLLPYKKDQRILHKFGNNFQIQMNFAVGIGQSIQGMVGSEFKIDPIYLGGKLEQIGKLSNVSKKYPNLVIMQKQLYENLTIGLKNHCRIMDYVRLNEYDQGKTQLYGVDLDLQYISPSRSRADKKKDDQPDINMKKQLNMQNLKDATLIQNYYAAGFINSKKQLRQVLRKKISDDMKRKYKMAFQYYISGDWVQAKQNFEQIMRVIKEDIFSKRIYGFMAERGFKFTENVQQYKSLKQL